MKKLLFTFFLASLFLVVSSNIEANAAYTDEELETIRETNEEYSVEITYEQAIERIAELSGKTVRQVMSEHQKSDIEAMSSNICGLVETLTNITVKSHTIKLSVILTSCRNGSFQWIDKDKKPMYVGIVGNGKGFAGDVGTELTNTGFYYVVNGIVHNHTSVSHAGTNGVTTSVWSTTYTLTSTSNKYAEIYTGKKFRQLIY